MKNISTKTCTTGFAMLLTFTGCSREQVQVYRVEKDQKTAPVAEMAAANPTAPAVLPAGHPDISGAPAMAETTTTPLTWTTPVGWTETTPTQMRVASFKISGAAGKQVDVSVIPLPGMAGSDDANVNRWRGQIGLPPMPPDDLQKTGETVDVGGQPGTLYDLDGSTSRILGVIQHRDDTAWFFKMTGAADLVEQQKPAFIDFLKSVKFSGATTAPAELPAALPAGHPAIGDMTTATATAAPTAPISHDGQPNWQVPAGWQEISGGQFLVAKFLIKGDAGTTAAVNVSTSSGDGGGLAANVNRWRGQLGLPPATDITTTPLTVNGGQAAGVDLTGTNAQTGQPARLLGVIVSQAGSTWIYKLMGNAKIVGSQQDAFSQFVQSVKY